MSPQEERQAPVESKREADRKSDPNRANGTEPAAGKPKKRKKSRLKLWIRISIPFLCVLFLFAGMTIGYVYVGKQPMSDIWKWETWRHAFDLIYAP
ncbi:DNA-directed RNA polymerase subunit beta [Gorillibacterium sp. CAU 1737]|uniref:DNA-directed RNA polymerase subunit beta n=1 Tax=Gorillibacterium sp. CAU 1737 TaxID=3140362 RepID=UPI00326129CC